MIETNELVQYDGGIYEMIECPTCGAGSDQMCSIMDDDGMGVELCSFIHVSRYNILEGIE